MASQRAGDSRYGWVLVPVGMVSMGFQSALFFANALLLAAIPDETGWSRAATAAALSSFVLGTGAWAPIVGTLLQRCGPRLTMSASALVTGAGLAALSLARSPEEVAAAMLLLLAPGTTGVGSLANYTAIQAWFRERRGAALALADSGSSLGLMLLVPIIQQLILAIGWRAACQVLGLVALLLGPLHLLMQRPAPLARSDRPDHPAGAAERSVGLLELLRQGRLWLVWLGMATSRFAFQLVAIHQVVYLTDQGFEAASLAAAFALTGLAGLVGRPGFGWLSDRIGPTRVYALITACLLLAIGSLIAAGESRLMLPLWLFALTFGAALGVTTLVSARQVADLVGSRSFGGAMGLGYAIGNLGGAAGPTAAALLQDLTRTYLTSFGAAALMGLASYGCMWGVERVLGSARHRR